MKFLRSTDHLKNLLILSEIEKGQPVTQAILAHAAGISVAMVNAYIKNLSIDGYLTMHGNNKTKMYQLTDKGVAQKKYLLVSLMAELIELTNTVSMQIKQALLPLTNNGVLRVFLYGAGETGKVCAKVIDEIPDIEVLGFIDDDITLQNTLIVGKRVISLDEALKIPFEKIIITTFVGILNIKEKLVNRLGDDNKIDLLSELGTSSWQGGI